MTTIHPSLCTCAVCGAKFLAMVVGSTNSFGYQDLDCRPPETMSFWLKVCPECGYTASDMEKATKIKREWLARKEYVTCEGYKLTGLTRDSYHAYMIDRELGNTNGAMVNILHTAWACDDRGDQGMAVICRSMAADLAASMGWPENCAAGQEIMLADILRRACRFDEVKKLFGAVKLPDKTLDKLLRFEVARAIEHDDACYTVGDAMRNA